MENYHLPQAIESGQAYGTLRVRRDADVHVLQIHRPQADNAINARLVEELGDALRQCECHAKIVVMEGLSEVFCTGGDFNEIRQELDQGRGVQQDPGPLFDLWRQLAQGPFVSVAHVADG